MTLLLHLGVAWACSLVDPPELALVPDPSDLEAPAAPTVGEVTVTRGRGPVGCGDVVRGSCDDIGSVEFPVGRADGDPDAETEVGYAVVHLSGDLPPFGLPTAEHPILGPTLWFSWIDAASDDQEPLDFVLGLVPVDRAGNEGPMVEVTVTDPGSVAVPCEEASGLGCRTVPGAGVWLVPLLGLGFRSRRRRRAQA